MVLDKKKKRKKRHYSALWLQKKCFVFKNIQLRNVNIRLEWLELCGEGTVYNRKFWLIFQWLESICILVGLTLYNISTNQMKNKHKEPGKALGKLLQSKWWTSCFIVLQLLVLYAELHRLGPTYPARSPTLKPGMRPCCAGVSAQQVLPSFFLVSGTLWPLIWDILLFLPWS